LIAERQVRHLMTLHSASAHLRPDPHYLDRPSSDCSLRREQREAVVIFNSEVAEDFGLHPQTAALAMNYFDRYCSSLVAEDHPIPKDRVQLLSMTCLLLASKFFDRHTPSIEDMCRIAHVYELEEFRAQELDTLGRLEWLLHVPLPHNFLTMLLRITNAGTANMTKCSCLLIDLTAFEYEFLKYPPLVIAYAAFLCSARFEGIKSDHMVYTELEMLRLRCGLEQSEIVRCVHGIMAYYELCFPGSPAMVRDGFMPVHHEFNDRSDTTTPTSIISCIQGGARRPDASGEHCAPPRASPRLPRAPVVP